MVECVPSKHKALVQLLALYKPDTAHTFDPNARQENHKFKIILSIKRVQGSPVIHDTVW